jgi:hypothetical protein
MWLETSKARATRQTKTDGIKDKAHIERKFERYFKFSVPVKSVRPHQVSIVYSWPAQHTDPGKIFSGPGEISSTVPRLLKNHLSELIKYSKT